MKNKWLVCLTLFIASLSISGAKEIPFVSSIDQIQYPVKDEILEIGVPEELANPNIFFPEVQRVVPVVIISFLHAQPDGIHGNKVRSNVKVKQNKFIDERLLNGPSKHPSNNNFKLKLSELSNWLLFNYIKGKFAVEESSRFRGYMDSKAIPHIGIQVVKHFNVYSNFITYNNKAEVDFHSLFKAVGLKKLVEEYGVKEVWISAQAAKAIPESNMASPVTKDISNSHRNKDDLPIYDKTYIVYGFYSQRSYDIFLHCRAHQYEDMLGFMNPTFFKEEFIGLGKDELIAGNCHHPINAEKRLDGRWKHYDYTNSQFIDSVVETWIPYTKTPTKAININYWASQSRYIPDYINLPVATQLNSWKRKTTHHNSRYTVGGGWCNERDKALCVDSLHASWLIMWSQQFPGSKPITFRKSSSSSTLYETTNWWDIIFDWDNHAAKKMRAKKHDKNYFGLYKKVDLK